MLKMLNIFENRALTNMPLSLEGKSTGVRLAFSGGFGEGRGGGGRRGGGK